MLALDGDHPVLALVGDPPALALDGGTPVLALVGDHPALALDRDIPVLALDGEIGCISSKVSSHVLAGLLPLKGLDCEREEQEGMCAGEGEEMAVRVGVMAIELVLHVSP